MPFYPDTEMNISTSKPSSSLCVQIQAFEEDQESSILRDRKYWTQWVIEAAEEERRRRVSEVKKLQEEEELERRRRRALASRMIEAEQRSQLREMFLEHTANSQWFQDITRSGDWPLDYEVMCPNSWFGCAVSCMLHAVDEHLVGCRYRQVPDETSPDQGDVCDTYDVVCPNAVLGCAVVCPRSSLAMHLATECTLMGTSREEELAERALSRVNVIQWMEAERVRRMMGSPIPRPRPLLVQKVSERRLHELFEFHTTTLQGLLSHDMRAFECQCELHARNVRPTQLRWIREITHVIQKLPGKNWQDSVVEPYGSFVTGLNLPSSDVDLVILNAPTYASLAQCVQHLARGLENDLREKQELFSVNVLAIERTSMPVVKVRLQLHSGLDIHFDLTFDLGQEPSCHDLSPPWPEHHGLACSSFIRTLLIQFPVLKALALVLKDFLVKQDLNEPYAGGLSSYGLTLMIISVFMEDPLAILECSRECRSPEQAQHQDKENQEPQIVQKKSTTYPFKLASPSSALASSSKRVQTQLLHGQQMARDFIQQLHMSDTAQNQPRPTLDQTSLEGKLLMNFLHRFGDGFLPEIEGISIVQGGFFALSPSSNIECISPTSSISSSTGSGRFYLEDPLDRRNNVGRNTFQIGPILHTFADAFAYLMSCVVRGESHDVRPLNYFLSTAVVK